MEKAKNNSIFLIVLLALVFGLAGGIGGEIISRVFLFQDIYKVPMFGEIDVPENVYSGSNLIIESPRKVIVEQNTKIIETVSSARKNIVGIYERLEDDIISPKLAEISSSTFEIENSYDLKSPISEGFVITSDGWIISKFFGGDLLTLSDDLATSTFISLKEGILEKYILISSDGEIYRPIDLEIDSDDKISFWRIEATDLGVKQFEDYAELEKGQLVLATNFSGATWVSSISQKYPSKMAQILSSDESYANLSLVKSIDEKFENGFLFSVDGDLIALLDKSAKITPISTYFSCLNCLLEKKKLEKPYLGLNYIDLGRFVSPSLNSSVDYGALISKNSEGIAVEDASPADLAGLKENDIILAVNTIKIDENNNLSDTILQFSPKQKINLRVLRDGSEMQILVDLGAK